MKEKTLLIATFFLSISGFAQTLELDTLNNVEGLIKLEDDPSKFSKWSIGIGLSYYFLSNKGGPQSGGLNGFYQFNKAYKLDFRLSTALKLDQDASPDEIEPLRFTEIQLIGHKRLFSKITAKKKKLTYSRDDFGAQLFSRKNLLISQKNQRQFDLDFGFHYLQLADFEEINIGNLPTLKNEIPRRMGNANYSSFVLGCSYINSRYLRYRVNGEEGITAGYIRYYLNYSYAFLHSIEVYGNPINPQIAEEEKQDFVSVFNSGWKLGVEAHDHLLSGPVSSYYGFEIGWKPHYHDPNTTLDHIRGTGLMMMFTLGVRIAQLPN